MKANQFNNTNNKDLLKRKLLQAENQKGLRKKLIKMINKKFYLSKEQSKEKVEEKKLRYLHRKQ